ncbi:MAG: hypothetical protein RIR00_1921 [Pseudomonadota bacterium]|jgi:alpha-ribazole phosphatase
MKLYLIRHPEPELPPGLCYGRLDVPAREVAAAAAGLRPQLPADLPLWTSPLRRCQELAALLAAAPVVDPRLAEMDFGAWEGRSWQEIGPAALDAWAADLAGYVPPGGESARQVQARALQLVAELEDKGIAAAGFVTHAGVIRVLLAHWRQLPVAAWLDIRPGFAEVMVCAVPQQSKAIQALNR